MNNADKPAYPCSVAVNAMGDTIGSWDIEGGEGLTKREYFAAMAMQAFITCNDRTENKSFTDGRTRRYSSEEIAGLSIVYADELLKQLEK